MGSLQEQFLKSLIEKFPHSGMTAVLENLPEELAAPYRVLPDKVNIAPELFFSVPSRILATIHPSWVEELLVRCPEALHPILRSVLLASESKEAQISEVLRAFLLSYLLRKWPERGALGVEFIEETEFRWLVACDEKTIVVLAELLAVYDVVDVVRQIVDKRILQKILSLLTPMQQRYLRSLLPRPARSAPLNKELVSLLLDESYGREQWLKNKGLQEFGHARKDQPKLLVWHVLHHIDREKALFFEKVMEKEISAKEQIEVQKRLTNAYQFLTKAGLL